MSNSQVNSQSKTTTRFGLNKKEMTSTSSKIGNFVNRFDHARMEKLFKIVTNVSKSNSIIEMMIAVMENI